MYESRVRYALDNFIRKGYFLEGKESYDLEEKSETGKGCLHVSISEENLCVRNFDKQGKFTFLREETKYGMQKSSDHLIFHKSKSGQWKLSIIEMKTSVGYKTWQEIKRQTRSSYLKGMAISSFLGVAIPPDSVQVYTTYENDKFDEVKAASSAMHKAQLGERAHDYKRDEWDRNTIIVTIDDEVRFSHRAILMTRDPSTNILTGKLVI